MLECEFDFDQLINSLHHHQPANSETVAGYEVYALDCTPNEQPETETLEDRGSLKSQKNEPVCYGHKYSSLVRLIHLGQCVGGTSGCPAGRHGPERQPGGREPQVQELDKHAT